MVRKQRAGGWMDFSAMDRIPTRVRNGFLRALARAACPAVRFQPPATFTVPHTNESNLTQALTIAAWIGPEAALMRPTVVIASKRTALSHNAQPSYELVLVCEHNERGEVDVRLVFARIPRGHVGGNACRARRVDARRHLCQWPRECSVHGWAARGIGRQGRTSFPARGICGSERLQGPKGQAPR